ncbi:integrase [Marinospirillum perlucidum]|uniref:integrase n=1 Tax=Marinospirillum perlucidum TaxID=1982602 RepID=UPI000DF37F80|nr:integrase [Marinospirillum perlucidum]
MSNVFLFKPRDELTAEKNLEEFIRKCRDDLTVFGVDLPWYLATWPKIATFAKLGVTTRKPKDDEVMDAEFIEFAKAYFRYQQGHKPTGTKNEGKALRALEAALLQVTGSAALKGLSYSVLDEAAQLVLQHYGAGGGYHAGRELQRLSEFVSDNKLVPSPVLGWQSPIRRPDDRNKTGKQGNEQRDKRLPNDLALEALAEIFANNPTDERDIFTTSVFAMLMSAPSRITEVLALPVDCEITEVDRDGVERYGWRFFSGKGFEGDIKWIPSEMVSVAKEAVSRLKKLSANARALAAWIEDHPEKFYRHESCPEVADDEPLTLKQVQQALGFKTFQNRGLAPKDGAHTLNSLWAHALEHLPSDFPWFDKKIGIKYKDALFALNINQFHGNRPTIPVELHKPSHNFFNNDLTPRETLGEKHKSIFDRHGYSDADGRRLKMTSHQARHLLNTIAQRGGLSNLEIAKWSGRADVKQNRTYNHMSEYELVSLAESFDPSKELFGPIGEAPANLPVSTLEFNALTQAAAHVTEYGYCVHDYTISPCEKYRDCVNCTEQVCIKGNTENLERIKARLAKVERLFEVATQSVNDGEMGADRWYQYHEKTLHRLRELASILEDPSVADGAQVKLRGNDFSQLKRVINKKSPETLGNDSEQPEMLAEATKLLGGGLG